MSSSLTWYCRPNFGVIGDWVTLPMVMPVLAMVGMLKPEAGP